MATFLFILGIGLWIRVWHTDFRVKKPKQAERDERPIIYNAEEREAIYNEAILRLIEDGQPPDIAQRVAESLVRAYDRKAIRKPIDKQQ